MPRVNGVFSLLSGSKGAPNTTIQSAPYNSQLDDFAQDLNLPRPLTAGGTGATTASGARSNLGLVPGDDVQAYDDSLQSIAGLTTIANQMIYTTGADAWATTSLTPFARTILDDIDAAAVRTTLQLNNVNNTSDANKPISTAQQEAFDQQSQAIGGRVSKAGDSVSGPIKFAYNYPEMWWGNAATGTGWRIVKDTPEGQIGSLVFQNSNDRFATNFKTAMYLSATGELFADVATVIKQLRVPDFLNGAGGQFNGFLPGNGDGANYNTYNFSLSGWWGMAMRSYDGSINGYYNFRSGTWDVKGGFQVNGNVVPHGGFKASAADIAAGTLNMFPDAAAVKAAFGGYTSAQQTWSAGATLVVAHNLGAAPREVFLEFVCKSAGGGYSVGDRVLMPSSTAAHDENYTNTGFSVSVDATNIRVHFASNGIPTVVKGGGGVFFSGGSVFDVIVRGRL